MFDELQLAIAIIEQGLALTFQHLLQLTDDFESLSIVQPTLAQKLKTVSIELYSGTSDSPHGLALERSELLKQVRSLPEFSQFLLPQTYKYLSKAAQNGPVIILNCTAEQADALIILHTDSQPITVSLAIANLEEIARQKATLKAALKLCNIAVRNSSDRAGRPAPLFASNSKDHFQSVLSWLWKEIVVPVYSVLKKVRTSVIKKFSHY